MRSAEYCSQAQPGSSSMQSVATCHTCLHCVLQVLPSQRLHQMRQRPFRQGNCVRVRERIQAFGAGWMAAPSPLKMNSELNV